MTDKQLAQALNESFSSLTFDEAETKFDYLTVSSRQKRCSMKDINRAWSADKLGDLLKKYDPIAFYSARSDFK